MFVTGYVVLYGEDSVRALLEILWLLPLAIATGVGTAAPYAGLTWPLIAWWIMLSHCSSDSGLMATSLTTGLM